MRKEFLIAVSLSALLLGCVDSSTGAAARADMEGDSHKVEAKVEHKKEATAHAEKAEAPAPAKEEVAPEAPAKEETPAPATPAPAEETAPATTEAPATEESAPAATAEVNTATCAGCHGANFEKKAMGVSKVVAELTKDEIVTALKGYKSGTYGGSMKALMAGQAASLDEATIEAIATKVGK
jgi:cytochrome c-type protein NapB